MCGVLVNACISGPACLVLLATCRVSQKNCLNSFLLIFLQQLGLSEHILYITSVYPAKGRPGSGTTKLDSEHKCIGDSPSSKATGHDPMPVRDWPVPLSWKVCKPSLWKFT